MQCKLGAYILFLTLVPEVEDMIQIAESRDLLDVIGVRKFDVFINLKKQCLFAQELPSFLEHSA